jgi:serine/threonine protein kinase/tetratricopeptide (TPR) repeat protein
VEDNLMTLEDIFLAAVEKAPADRAAYLEAACGADAELRAQVEALLRSHEEAGSLLEQPLFRPGPTVDVDSSFPAGGGPSAAEQPGVSVGPYKLLQQIGEGGMGTVWMAQQTAPVKRLVAVKLIKAGMDSRQVLARFEAERQALALMDHPNIARVLDAGATAAGRPYFVMELVKGAPLTKYCDEHRLTPRERLELFIPVCQAIQHAHQKGVIHRDIKPSNVLVSLYDGKPAPRVIDFGVAKAAGQPLTEKTLVTGLGAVVGTLEYMSPEQAELNQLDIDTRSDIYSLGILLYELLTGTTPLENRRLKEAAMLEVLRLIREEEPPKPSTRLSDSKDSLPSISAQRHMEPAKLTKLVRGELDWIVMKALEKDRNRRYDTANGFAQDVLRYLADESVQACPPSAWYRCRKFARRNKTALTTVVLVGLALLAGTAVSIWQAVRATQARDAERAARDQLDAARDEQDQQRARINRELSEALVEATAAGEKARAAPSGDGGAWGRLRETLRRAETLAAIELADPVLVGRVQALVVEVKNDEANHRMVARLEEIRLNPEALKALFINPSVNEQLGGKSQAYEAAFREYGLPVFDLEVEEASRRIAASPIREQLVTALDDCAASTEGRSPRLLKIARGATSSPWRRQYFDLRRGWDWQGLVRLAQQPEALDQPPATICMLATVGGLGRAPHAFLQLLRAAQQRHPADLWINHTIAELHSSMGKEKGASAEEALRHLEECVGHRRAALTARPEARALRVALASSLIDVGQFLERKPGRDAVLAAIAYYSEATEWYPSEGTYNVLGFAHCQAGQWPEAIAYYRKAIKLDPTSAAAHCWLGKFLQWNSQRDRKELEEAVSCYRVAIALDPNYTEPLISLGHILLTQNKPDEAIVCYRKWIALQPKDFWPHCSLGNALCAQNKLDEAIACYGKAIEFEPTFHQGYSRRGLAYCNLKQYDRALADFAKAIELQGPQANPNDLAWLLATCPDPKFRNAARAVELMKKAVETYPTTGTFWNTLGVAHYHAGDWNAAQTALHKSMELSKGGNSVDWFFLAMTHWQQGDRDEARKWYDQAVAWMDQNQPENDELRRFRAEAEGLLGLDKKKD